MGYKIRAAAFYHLSKPGIVYANCLTAIAGYCLGSQLHIAINTLSGLIAGLALVIVGACASNNYLDRHLDAVMPRTQRRVLVSGVLQPRVALIYAAMTTGSGLLLLATTQWWPVTALAAIAWIDYVVIYGALKRRSVHGTLVGCVSGAIPLVAGYVAATGRFDSMTVLLFLLMVSWQMGHFYGIALYRLADYRASGIPVMPVVHGTQRTSRLTLGYITGFLVVGAALGLFGHLSLTSTGLLLLGGIYWLYKAVSRLATLPSAAWGKQVFGSSLIVMIVMVAALVANPLFA